MQSTKETGNRFKHFLKNVFGQFSPRHLSNDNGESDGEYRPSDNASDVNDGSIESNHNETSVVKNTSSVPSESVNLSLEKAHIRLLERIQSCLGFVLRLEQDPSPPKLIGKLVTEVQEFITVLEDYGLTVISNDQTQPGAFVSVYDAAERSESQVIVPAILRGETIVLKGTRCVPPKNAPISSDTSSVNTDGTCISTV